MPQQISGGAQLRNITGPGYGPATHLDTMRRTELRRFCDAFGLTDKARALCTNRDEAKNPPAVLLRQVIAQSGMTGKEPLPERKEIVDEPKTNGHMDLDSMKMPQVRKLASEKGVKFTPSHKKAELIEMLRNA